MNLLPELRGLVVEFVLFLGEFEMAFFAVRSAQTGFGNLAVVVGRLSANNAQAVLATDLGHSCHHLAYILMDQVEQVLVVDEGRLNLLVDFLVANRERVN
jgi:hypothetical protein